MKKTTTTARTTAPSPSDDLQAIDRYAAEFAAALPVSAPYAGDCYYCLIHDEHGKPLGDLVNYHDHLRLHIEEGYFFGSLLENAINDLGASRVVKRGVFQEDCPYLTEYFAPSIRRNVRKLIRRYLTRRLTGAP